VIEDEVSVATGVQRCLSSDGFDVQVVHDGAAGFARVRGDQFDLIVLDILLPSMNGYRVPPGLPMPTSVDESMRRWARHNGCASRYREERISPEVRKRAWPHCKAATVLYIVDNGSHAWPGKPQPAFERTFGHGTTDIDATSLMFAFFFAHTR
jgi:hypothetical protein